jgi:hypothetical protein
VRDRLRVAAAEPVAQAQAVEQPPAAQPPPAMQPPPAGLQPLPPGAQPLPPGIQPLPPGAGPGGPASEPAPMYQASPLPYDLNPPKMPPYSWPTYAPYNNYSRVAYPLLYPYNSWPFIGPMYPFPKVPLGWRSVKLQWEDGYWWYSKLACGHDWWRVRYW